MSFNFIVVLLGPSASGKSYLVNKILPELDSDFQVVTKYISRDARPNELKPDGTLVYNDIIPGTSPEFIQSLDYHYATQREDTTLYYGFPKSRIDELLAQGKNPVINKCNEATYRQLCHDYPNRMLTLFVDPATVIDEISAADSMKHQGRSEAEIAQRAKEDPQADLWFEHITPNHVGVINPASIRYDEIGKKPLSYFVGIQLINIFKSLYETKDPEKYQHFNQLHNSYLKGLQSDAETYSLYKNLITKSQHIPTVAERRARAGLLDSSKAAWWKWAGYQFFMQNHGYYFFDPEQWNSYARMNNLPTVEEPERFVPDEDFVDSFEYDRGMD